MATEMIVIFHHDERGEVRTWSETGKLVRCKDCKYYDMGECTHNLGLVAAHDENYCSYGKMVV